eukprot:10942403-Ditylum_brightwellii.AAC.1
MNDDVLSQLEEKHPKQKAPAAPCMGISPEHLNKAIRGLKSDVAPELGGIHNEHITPIVFSYQRDVPPLAKSLVSHVCTLANAIHLDDILDHFYVYYMATCLMTANKQDQETLKE